MREHHLPYRPKFNRSIVELAQSREMPETFATAFWPSVAINESLDLPPGRSGSRK